MGSVSLSIAEIDLKREIIRTAYRFHHGDVRGAFREAVDDFDLGGIGGIAATSSTPSILKASRRYDNRLAIMEAARHFHGKIGSILVVGGETFGLIGFDGNGRYRSFKTNTSCAAGTGSFLDQQARRLNLSSTEALSDEASGNRGTVPKMASRSVFAKTDLVHAQQEGYSLEQICDGLCHGLARNIVDTLSMDREAQSPIIFTGGVSRNKAVVRHIQSILGKDLVVDETGMYGAIGSPESGIRVRGVPQGRYRLHEHQGCSPGRGRPGPGRLLHRHRGKTGRRGSEGVFRHSGHPRERKVAGPPL